MQLGKKKNSILGEKKVKVSLFAGDVIIYVENSMESTKKLLELVSNFTSVSGQNNI